MEMFDELISTTIKPDGTVEERRVTEARFGKVVN